MYNLLAERIKIYTVHEWCCWTIALQVKYRFLSLSTTIQFEIRIFYMDWVIKLALEQKNRFFKMENAIPMPSMTQQRRMKTKFHQCQHGKMWQILYFLSKVHRLSTRFERIMRLFWSLVGILHAHVAICFFNLPSYQNYNFCILYFYNIHQES